jgi:hypothetical protein
MTSPDPRSSDSRGGRAVLRKALLSLAATGALLLLFEGASSLLMSWRESRWGARGTHEQEYAVYDAELGWALEKNVSRADFFGPGAALTTNAQGLRASEEYTPRVPAGRYRVVCLGDAQVLGYGVGDGDTLGARLEARDPRLQVVNMGMTGYGLGQSWSWYLRDGTDLEADVLLFAITAASLERLCASEYLGRYPKPVVELVEGRPVVTSGELARDFEADAGDLRKRRFIDATGLGQLFHRTGGAAPAVEGVEIPCADVAAAVLTDLHRRCGERGRALVLVCLPTLASHPDQSSALTAWMDRAAREHGFLFLDLSAVELSGASFAARYDRVAEALLGGLREHMEGFLAP